MEYDSSFKIIRKGYIYGTRSKCWHENEIWKLNEESWLCKLQGSDHLHVMKITYQYETQGHYQSSLFFELGFFFFMGLSQNKKKRLTKSLVTLSMPWENISALTHHQKSTQLWHASLSLTQAWVSLTRVYFDVLCKQQTLMLLLPNYEISAGSSAVRAKEQPVISLIK